VIGIAIVGALTSMCMSEKKKPVEGWIGAVGASNFNRQKEEEK
tara:strand:+ start:535 stop:663 length:129 start_codon:yes stop_codon:yes gene_type:complete